MLPVNKRGSAQIRIVHLSASDISGGAARAAYRIHRCLSSNGQMEEIVSTMRVISKLTEDDTVLGGNPRRPRSIKGYLREKKSNFMLRHFQSGNPILHSNAIKQTGIARDLIRGEDRGKPDIVHLHWLGNNTISIEEVGQLRMPLVWTLHDQWPFCGAEHYTAPPRDGECVSSDIRFSLGYNPDNRPSYESGPDINRHTWMRKRRAWQRPIHIVATTRWLEDCARQSALMHDWPITTIPYPLDLNIWKPVDQHQARTLLDLPVDRPLILFGAIGGTKDPRKGADLLLEALNKLQPRIQGSSLDGMELVVFGESPPTEHPKLGFPIHYRGRLQDDLSLRLHYAAADVMVVPSRQEAFGQTASEAQACGTPVVCFATGGLVDVVEHECTGLCVDPFDTSSLAEAILTICADQERRNAMGVEARERAIKLWKPERICNQYEEVYRRAIELL